MSNIKVSSDIDTFLRKSTKEEAATFLGLEDTKAVWGQITGTLANQTDLVSALALKGSAVDVAINTAKVGITTAQAQAITDNTAKVGITSAQAQAIIDNTAKTGITSGQASAIVANTAKIGITPDEQDAIEYNRSDIASNTTNIATNTTNIATKAPIASPTFTDKITINSGFPADGKLLMVDNGTTVGNHGALVKQNNKLYVGPSETTENNWVFQNENDGKRVLKSPINGGIRFGQTGSFLDHYKFGTFLPKLESGDGTVVQSVYETRQANYVRIGDLVQVNIFISITNFDTAWKTSTKDWRITDLPYKAIGNHNIEIRPIFGWLDLGNNNITGSLASGNDYLWVEQFVDGGTTAGANTNLQRINGNRFVTHPFNFTTGTFEFVITGSYKTNEA